MLGCRHGLSSLTWGSSQVLGASPRCPQQGTVPLPTTRTWNSPRCTEAAKLHIKDFQLSKQTKKPQTS